MRRFLLVAATLLVAACARTPEPVHFFAEGQPPSLADTAAVAHTIYRVLCAP